MAVTDFLGYGVATREWKLLYYPRQDEGFLYHRMSDPCDRINRFSLDAAKEADARVTRLMLFALLRWRARLLPPSTDGRLLTTTMSGARATTVTRAMHQLSQSSDRHAWRGVDAELGLMQDLVGL